MMNIFNEISIIIPTFYPGNIINKCLETLPKNVDIIIVDNGDDAYLSDLIKNSDHNLRHFKIGDVGLPMSFNYALKKTKYENILITQPDVTFHRDAIQKLIEASTKYQNFGILAPHVYEDNKYSKYNSLNLHLDKKGKIINFKNKSKVVKIIPDGDCCVDAVNSTAIFFKKSIINKINGWDENIYTYLEDLDLCLRLRKSNLPIIKVKSSIVHHIGFGSHKKENALKSDMSRNWHFIWSSLYFKHKYSSKSEYLNFLLKNILKYFFKTF
ncbi:glycosyltransferase family 2 protein, partial [Candidatus Pelagibacter sp. HIMB1521]|uniref:glycosyltransferase family 2 protein n=1 Tax=Candidatus Pelagibacter sp. HIMB1521 TaxID=3413344 RepID=UPI003F84B223